MDIMLVVGLEGAFEVIFNMLVPEEMPDTIT